MAIASFGDRRAAFERRVLRSAAFLAQVAAKAAERAEEAGQWQRAEVEWQRAHAADGIVRRTVFASPRTRLDLD